MTEPMPARRAVLPLDVVLELIGTACLLLAAFLFDYRLGIALLGLCFIAAGFLVGNLHATTQRQDVEV